MTTKTTFQKGDRVMLRGYEGTVIALPGEDASLGYIPPSMVGVAMGSGRTLAAMDECTPIAQSAAAIFELTPSGEQAVIPGCERNASPQPGQMDLFG